MLNENAKVWVAALRSGDYTQTKQMLHRVTQDKASFCCLGVACELYRDSVGGEWVAVGNPEWNEQAKFMDDEGGLSDSDLTLAVMDWLGLVNSEGTFYDAEGVRFTLVGLNDQANRTFAQIADVIESKPKGLFNA